MEVKVMITGFPIAHMRLGLSMGSKMKRISKENKGFQGSGGADPIRAPADFEPSVAPVGTAKGEGFFWEIKDFRGQEVSDPEPASAEIEPRVTLNMESKL